MERLIDVNAHLHTPFSFSAFQDIPDALDRAVAEGVGVVGINDFYTLEGHRPWMEGCRRRRLYPLLNIELIALDTRAQAAGERINDPGNPGRTYLSGKGLAFPTTLHGAEERMLSQVRARSNDQVRQMCARLNGHLEKVGAGFSLDFPTIRRELTCGNVRERHLARALRLAVESRAADPAGRAILYAQILGIGAVQDGDSPAKVENTIRSRLLKAGGAAFVPEQPDAFLPLEQVCRLIRAAGGIPTYPFLGDDAQGRFTDFEQDLPLAVHRLRQAGITSVEFITTRNTTAVLERYAAYLEDEGFIVTFGSEHNTPAMEPIRLRTRDADGLTDRLRAINYRGACAIAAHQAGLDSPDAGDELIRNRC